MVDTIAFRVDGESDGIQFGKTSLCDRISNHFWLDISVIDYNGDDLEANRIKAEKALGVTKYLRSLYVVDGYNVCVDGSSCKLLVDRFCTFNTWVEEQHIQFISERRVNWFDYIESNFKNIFSGVCRGLKHTYTLGLCHGDLLKGAVIKMEQGKAQGRILTASPSCKEFSVDAAIQDFTDLWQLMVRVLGRGINDESMSDSCDLSAIMFRLQQSNLPGDLYLFLHHLSRVKQLSKPVPQEEFIWLIDNPYVWNPEERNSFMRKVWHLHVNRNTFSIIQKPLPKYFDPAQVMGWKYCVRQNQRLQEMSTRGDGRMFTSNLAQDQVIGVSKIYRDGHEHYNEGCVTKLNDVDYSEFMNKNLKYPCAELWSFLTPYLWCKTGGMRSYGTEIKFLASVKKY